MTSVLETTCCIAGGGPAGMMLGVLDEFLALPHYKAYLVYGQFGARRLRVADFTRLPTRCGFIAFMPQWDFLDFLARQGERHGAFELRMKTEVTGLLEEDGRVCGVRAGSPEGELEIQADLVIGADGRTSAVRAHSALEVEEFGAPMDVLWFRLFNLAIQDAVACANRIAGLLRAGALTEADLAAVQRRRLFPTWIAQRAQLAVQNRVTTRLLARERSKPLAPPLPLRVVSRLPLLQRIAARIVGVGVRPEHIGRAILGRGYNASGDN